MYAARPAGIASVCLGASRRPSLLLSHAFHRQADGDFCSQRLGRALLLAAYVHQPSNRFLEPVQVQASSTLVQVTAHVSDIVVVELAVDIRVQRLQAVATSNHRAPPVVLASTPLVALCSEGESRWTLLPDVKPAA